MESKGQWDKISAYRLNDIPVPVQTEVKYLGLTLDQKLIIISTKKTEINLKFRQMHWLLGCKSQLSTENKVLLWGCSKPSNIKIIQTLQSKILILILNVPWYIINKTIHEDISISYIQEEITRFSNNYFKKLSGHPNNEVNLLNDPPTQRKRLKKKWLIELKN